MVLFEHFSNTDFKMAPLMQKPFSCQFNFHYAIHSKERWLL